MDYRRKFSAYASQPDAEWRLFCVSFLEALLMPFPSDFLLIPMALLNPKQAWRYALLASLGSVLGGIALYFLGQIIFQILASQELLAGWPETVLGVFQFYSGIFLVSAGFSSVPFSIVAFLGGLSQVEFATFVVIAFIVRTLRYGVVCWLIWRGDTRYQQWLERNFYSSMLVMTLALMVVSAVGVLLFETS